MKIAFDTSIHLGQFCINNEHLRVASKNSQALISETLKNEVIGVEAFNENSYADHIIWSLERGLQDTFYRFMDVFHSVKHIIRVPLTTRDAEQALKIQRQLGIDIANALTCAVAINEEVNEVHTFYHELQRADVVDFMRDQFNIVISEPATVRELRFGEPGLEQYYQDALAAFHKAHVNLADRFHV
ncbi:MAG: DUF6190 family protein [Gammaproteobacteria bacterium]